MSGTWVQAPDRTWLPDPWIRREYLCTFDVQVVTSFFVQGDR